MGSAGVLRHRLQPQRGPSRPSRHGGRGRSRAATPSSSTVSTSSAAGEGPTRTWPCWSPSASTPPATGGHRLLRGYTESAESWREFFSWLKGTRALRRTARHRRQVRGDARCARGGVPRGPLPALHGAFLPQRAGKGSRDTRRKAAAHAEGASTRRNRARGMRQKAEEVAEELESMRLGAAARTVRDGFAETLAYTEFPPEHWRRIRDEQRDRAHQPRDQGGGRGSSGPSQTAIRL